MAISLGFGPTGLSGRLVGVIEKEAAVRVELVKPSLDSTGRFGPITTEIASAGPFYYAESYHQQYLDKNPNGYCGIGGTGVSCPIGVATAE